jgi:hypothetical protein
MATEYKSPIKIHLAGTRVEIEHAATGEILAHCQIGDDDAVETIADILSAKRLSREAMALRNLMQEQRHVGAR